MSSFILPSLVGSILAVVLIFFFVVLNLGAAAPVADPAPCTVSHAFTAAATVGAESVVVVVGVAFHN